MADFDWSIRQSVDYLTFNLGNREIALAWLSDHLMTGSIEAVAKYVRGGLGSPSASGGIQMVDAKIPKEIWLHMGAISERADLYIQDLGRESVWPTKFKYHINRPRVCSSILMSFLSGHSRYQPSIQIATPAIKGPGGVDAKYNWEKYLIEAAVFIYEHGITSNSKVYKHLRTVFPDVDGGPSDTQMKQHIAPLCRRFRLADDG